MKACMCY